MGYGALILPTLRLFLLLFVMLSLLICADS
jgi:hypothetical protein